MKDLNDKATGKSLTASDWNQQPSEVQNVIEATGQTLTAANLNQLGKGVAQYAANGDFFTVGGTANAITLTAVGGKQLAPGYTDGQRLRFRPVLSNTGGVTIAHGGAVAKTALYNGMALAAGRLAAGKTYEFEYRASDDKLHFLLTEDITGFKIWPYDLRVARYEGKSFSVAGQEINPQGLFFKPDGLTMFVVGATNDTVYQYTLSTPWDVSTASYASKSKSVTTEATFPADLFFKSDGTIMYIVDDSTDTVYQYTLSTPWDVSTASYASKSKSVTTEDVSPLGIFFKPDGLTMYMIGAANDTVYQYTLSTPWDVSTASYASKSFSVTPQETAPRSVFFKPDGLTMFVVGVTNDTVYQYTLSTAWDVSTASYDSVLLLVSPQETSPEGLFFKPDGRKMYVLGTVNDRVYQYTTSRIYGV